MDRRVSNAFWLLHHPLEDVDEVSGRPVESMLEYKLPSTQLSIHRISLVLLQTI